MHSWKALSQARVNMRLDHRPFDVAVIGATGFTGRLACEYLHTKCPDVKWLATARSETKLEQLRAELGLESSQTRVVDCTDPAGLSALATECSVVANFAGTPFLDKALPVVEQCVTHACHYVDITGEVPLQRASYDKYHEAACATKTLIIHAGQLHIGVFQSFDQSIPVVFQHVRGTPSHPLDNAVQLA